MSRVFVAQDVKLGRRVAVKVLSREVAAEIKTERFRLEIQLAARLQHPHIVPLLQSGEINGILYFTMPYVEGESLRKRLDREGALPIPEGIRILRQVASAISYAHRNGVVHRDIKPDNVLLSDEFALVADFGVARALSASATLGDQRLTSGGVALGTPAYMAPEQALADPEIDHRADIYAFGCMAYEVLTGEPPFRGKSAQSTLAAHVVQPPDPILSKRADIPPEIAEMVMKCLEKKQGDRPQSAAELLPVFDSVSTSSSGPNVATAAQPATKRQTERGPIRWAIAGGAVLAVLIVTWASFARGRPASAAGSEFSSVAVLPLENIGGSPADEYFSDGMTDELANALGRLPGLKVASRTSAYAFKGKHENVEDIGKKLNVQAVLEGSVTRVGDSLKVSAQLTNVADGLTLWSDSYKGDTRDVFRVQDDIARKIAEELKPKLGSRAATFSSDSRGTTNLPAYDQYLRGQYFLNRRGADNLRLAVAYFDSAIAKDANFARAYAASATAYALLPEYTDAGPRDASAKTHAAAEKALSIDPTLAEAYTAIGLSEVHDWNFDKAEAAYRKALQLNPQYATAHQWYGELFYHTGRLDSSVAQIRRAGELDPLAPIIPAATGYALVVSGKYDQAIAEIKKGVQLAPTLGLHHFMLGDAYMAAGKYAQAVPELELAVKLDPELALRRGFLAYGYGFTGQTAKARTIISNLEERQRKQGGSGVALCIAYLGVRENDRALSALEQAVNEHDISLITQSSLVPDKIFDPLRKDPRFDALLGRMNLLQYDRALHKR